MYLTPQRFREMGFGIDVSELDDAELMSLAHQAKAVVDAYCNVPRLPQVHDLRGGTITGEQHTWRMPVAANDVGQRRMYLLHKPLTSISQFRIYVTNTQYVEIAPTELLINQIEGYFEVVSLVITAQTGLYGALIIPNVGLATPVAKINYTYGREYEVANEELLCTDGQTWRAQNQWWFSDTDRAPVIKKNGVVQTTGFTIDYDEGSVVFDVNLMASDRVTASYHHKLAPEVQYGAGHIMAYLHGQAELHARGMAHLSSLKVAEVSMATRAPVATASLAAQLDLLVPEAALLLSGFAADNLTVR